MSDHNFQSYSYPPCLKDVSTHPLEGYGLFVRMNLKFESNNATSSTIHVFCRMPKAKSAVYHDSQNALWNHSDAFYTNDEKAYSSRMGVSNSVLAGALKAQFGALVHDSCDVCVLFPLRDHELGCRRILSRNAALQHALCLSCPL